jgi:hypothetical protein
VPCSSWDPSCLWTAVHTLMYFVRSGGGVDVGRKLAGRCKCMPSVATIHKRWKSAAVRLGTEAPVVPKVWCTRRSVRREGAIWAWRRSQNVAKSDPHAVNRSESRCSIANGKRLWAPHTWAARMPNSPEAYEKAADRMSSRAAGLMGLGDPNTEANVLTSAAIAVMLRMSRGVN